MGKSECDFGENGCVTVQNLQKDVGKMEVTQKNLVDESVKHDEKLEEIRKLLFRAVVFMGSLTAIVQVAIKFWK